MLLDELLNSWKTPPIPASLRESVRAGIAAKRPTPRRPWFPGWRWLAAGAAAAAVVFMIADTSALSKKAGPPPYRVDSEIILDDGTLQCPNCWWKGDPRANPGPQRMLMTSYNLAGSEVILSWSAPDHPLQATFFAAKLAIDGAVERAKRRFLLSSDTEAGNFAVVYSAVGQSHVLTERTTLVNSGCQSPGPPGKVLGREVMLNYPTVAAQYDFWKARLTVWMAPELSCFALRATVEAEQPDGSWKLVREKKALKVTVNR